LAILRLTQEIRRPLQDVFDTVVDAGHFASWNPTIKASRPLTPGEPAEGSRFEWELRGFGTVHQELQEFERNLQVRIVPDTKSIAGGHRFTFTDLGGRTRVEHELEMTPKGLFKLMSPMMRMIGKRNLRATADALKRHLES
jgi:uncharacterized protein YndB with AHSA1/START domain